MLSQAEVSPQNSAPVSVKVDIEVLKFIPDILKKLAHLDLPAEFLPYLSNQAELDTFARFDLPAGELPKKPEFFLGRALGYEYSSP